MQRFPPFADADTKRGPDRRTHSVGKPSEGQFPSIECAVQRQPIQVGTGGTWKIILSGQVAISFGNTKLKALAAPVDVGIIEIAAPLDLLKSL